MPMTRNDARSSVQIRKLTYSALYLAIALVLPFLTGQIPEIGSMLCPMHIPALLCGFVCGWPWGLAVGFVSPLLRPFSLGCLRLIRQWPWRLSWPPMARFPGFYPAFFPAEIGLCMSR